MPSPLRTRLAQLADTILGHEPSGPAAPPRTGIDPSSKRHFTALIVGTLAIAVFGILVALFVDTPSTANPTPTIFASPSPAGSLPTDNSGFSLAI